MAKLCKRHWWFPALRWDRIPIVKKPKVNRPMIPMRKSDNGLSRFAQKCRHFICLTIVGRNVTINKQFLVNNQDFALFLYYYSSCPDSPSSCGWNEFSAPGPNPQILYGALVGGPDEFDNFVNDRQDYIYNEVTCDYNAGFQSAVAGNLKTRNIKNKFEYDNWHRKQ